MLVIYLFKASLLVPPTDYEIEEIQLSVDYYSTDFPLFFIFNWSYIGYFELFLENMVDVQQNCSNVHIFWLRFKEGATIM